MLQLLLGQIPEAIYFALFIILTKSYKNKRILFIVLSIIEYILLLNLFPYSTWSHILYFVLMYVIMKMLYKEKCQITDIFALGISSIILGVVSIMYYFASLGNVIIANIVSKIVIFTIMILCKPVMPDINNLYKKLWNRGEHKHKMKTTTFRAMNLVIFNFSFAIINLLLVSRFIVRLWR